MLDAIKFLQLLLFVMCMFEWGLVNDVAIANDQLYHCMQFAN